MNLKDWWNGVPLTRGARSTIRQLEGLVFLAAGVALGLWGFLGDRLKGPNTAALIAGGVMVLFGMYTIHQGDLDGR